jgi:hypothetical protein
MPKTDPAKYLGIRMWGERSASGRAYILRQQQLAAKLDAPIDAIFQRFNSNEWATVSGLGDEHPFRKEYRDALKRANMP